MERNSRKYNRIRNRVEYNNRGENRKKKHYNDRKLIFTKRIRLARHQLYLLVKDQ